MGIFYLHTKFVDDVLRETEKFDVFCLFYPNVTTLRSAICYRKSIYLSSVVFVRPTQPVKIFGNITMPFCSVAIR